MKLLKEGTILRDTYEVERFLGEGAFAEVYRVRHRYLGRQAMKVFKATGISREDMDTLLEEAVVLSRIGHPNIVRVFDANTVESTYGVCGFFTMEYVAGGSLEKFWQSYGMQFIPVETTVDVIRQVCRGLAVAHLEKPPVIHRDIKPQNILVGYDAMGLRVRVSDFGMAKRVNPLTLMASAKGTRAFKPPETFQDIKADSCAGDVWAVGTTLYLLLTDRFPYPANNDLGFTNSKAFNLPMIPPSQLNLQVDPLLDQIVMRSLALTLKDRYATANDLLADLEKWRPQVLDALGQTKSAGSSDASKIALGVHSPANQDEARKMARRAVELAQYAGELLEAADLMEEALNKWPGLRDGYEYRLRLWRQGIVM